QRPPLVLGEEVAPQRLRIEAGQGEVVIVHHHVLDARGGQRPGEMRLPPPGAGAPPPPPPSHIPRGVTPKLARRNSVSRWIWPTLSVSRSMGRMGSWKPPVRSSTRPAAASSPRRSKVG